MKKTNSYPLNFNKLLYLVLPIVLIITVPFIIQRIINIANMFGSTEGYNVAIDIVVIILLFAVLILTLTCLFIARYTITDKHIILRIGVFFNRIKLSSCDSFTYMRADDKLFLTYAVSGEYKQIQINIQSKFYDEFIEKVKKINKNVDYTIDSSTD